MLNTLSWYLQQNQESKLYQYGLRFSAECHNDQNQRNRSGKLRSTQTIQRTNQIEATSVLWRTQGAENMCERDSFSVLVHF